MNKETPIPDTAVAEIHSKEIIDDYVDAINQVQEAVAAVQGLLPDKAHYSRDTTYEYACVVQLRMVRTLHSIKGVLEEIANGMEKLGK